MIDIRCYASPFLAPGPYGAALWKSGHTEEVNYSDRPGPDL